MSVERAGGDGARPREESSRPAQGGQDQGAGILRQSLKWGRYSARIAAVARAMTWHRGHRWPYAVLFALGIVLHQRAAFAAPVDTVDLRYAAGRSCPSEEDFVSVLRRASASIQVVADDTARRSVDVDLEAFAASARGRFRFVDRADGTTIEREMSGPDCEAVARALALMLALAIHRSYEEQPSEVSSDAAAAPTAPVEEVSPPAAASPTVRDAPRPTAAPPKVSPKGKLQISLDLQGALTRAVVNQALPFAALAFDIQPLGWRWRPALGVTLRQSLSHEVAVAGGGASFLWTTGAFRVCPHVIGLGAIDVAPCVEAAVGALRADASGLPGARTSTEPWVDATGLLAARWHVSARWFLVATASATVALRRTRFELSSGVLIAQSPALGPGAGLGVGLRL